MSSSSLSEDLRRYRALAWALVVTLIVSVALFVQFLRMDHARAAHTLSLNAAHHATIGQIQITSLIEHIEVLGVDYILFEATEDQLLSRLHTLHNIDATTLSFCVRDGDSVRVMQHSAKFSAESKADCTTEFVSFQTVALHWTQDSIATDFNVSRSPIDESLQIEARVRGNGTRELRVMMSAMALLDALALDERQNIDSETVCLSLLVSTDYLELACQVEGKAAPGPEALATLNSTNTDVIYNFETDGLKWLVSVKRNPQSYTGTLTILPFSMFAIALALGAGACVFAYQSTDKNILLESRANELRTRLDQLEELEQQNSLLDQFAAMAAHDLQAPIRFIVANAYLLISELEELDRSDLLQMAETQVEQGERMRALILGLLQFCRAGQSTLIMSRIDTRQLVDEEIRLLMANQEYTSTQVIIGTLPSALVCDAEKLSHIFRNLLGNAVKFSQQRQAPKVLINASRDSTYGVWTFSVTDNGPGIDKSHQERIFRPFSRLDSNTEGTGMGLAIVKIMLERLSGTIWIDHSDKEGSTFCFTISGTLPLESSDERRV